MLLRNLISIVALPVTVTEIMPGVLFSLLHCEILWKLHSITFLPILIICSIFIMAGLVLLFLTISLFVTMGDGTITHFRVLQASG